MKDIKAFIGGVLINGNGSDPVEDAIVIVNGDTIEAAGERTEYNIPDGADARACVQLLDYKPVRILFSLFS
jgi:hypothetical protein